MISPASLSQIDDPAAADLVLDVDRHAKRHAHLVGEHAKTRAVRIGDVERGKRDQFSVGLSYGYRFSWD